MSTGAARLTLREVRLGAHLRFGALLRLQSSFTNLCRGTFGRPDSFRRIAASLSDARKTTRPAASKHGGQHFDPTRTESSAVDDGIAHRGVHGVCPRRLQRSELQRHHEISPEDTYAVRFFAATSQIVSMDLATGARMERTTGPGLKVSPQFLGAHTIGYLLKGPAQKGQLAFTVGQAGPPGAGPGAIRNPT